ncbi:MAG: lytic transglycosylase domain-containing protein [Xanthobacteraceae bacterium]
MRYAAMTLLAVLGAGLAGAGPAALDGERSVIVADRGGVIREPDASPAAVTAPAGVKASSARPAGDTVNKADQESRTDSGDEPDSAGKNVTGANDKPSTGGKGGADAETGRKGKDEAEDAASAAEPDAQADRATAKISSAMDSICLIMESAATANGLPLEFFARVIWQESRFQPDAVGPVTRSGHRAQGIAQFMPYTAEERGLLDPFNPVAALPKAAEFLSELRSEFGNLGLAAAAYNAGPRRVRDYIAGRGGMPGQTRHYVSAITGRTVDEWVNLRSEGAKDVLAKPTSCRQLAALLTKQPSFFIGELERRVAEGKLRPWGVQLSAGFSRQRVLQMYARIERRYRVLLEELDPMIIRTVLRSRGTNAFYQVRVGVDTRAAANRLCATLSSKGAACMVLKNSRGSPQLLSKRTDEKANEAKEAKKSKEAREETRDAKKTR